MLDRALAKPLIMKRQIFVLAAIVIASAGVGAAGDATTTWAQNCASCHGKDGSGNTLMGKNWA